MNNDKGITAAFLTIFWLTLFVIGVVSFLHKQDANAAATEILVVDEPDEGNL